MFWEGLQDGFLPFPIKQPVLVAGKITKRRTSSSFEIYEPIHAEKRCIECHVGDKEGELKGVFAMRFNAAVEAARAGHREWVQSSVWHTELSENTEEKTRAIALRDMGRTNAWPMEGNRSGETKNISVPMHHALFPSPLRALCVLRVRNRRIRF